MCITHHIIHQVKRLGCLEWNQHVWQHKVIMCFQLFGNADFTWGVLIGLTCVMNICDHTLCQTNWADRWCSGISNPDPRHEMLKHSVRMLLCKLIPWDIFLWTQVLTRNMAVADPNFTKFIDLFRWHRLWGKKWLGVVCSVVEEEPLV